MNRPLERRSSRSVPAVIQGPDPLGRGWALLLLDATSKTGIAPISKLRFHRLAYFANCLAPLYRASPSDTRIVKFSRGPFYPEVQWHLDRLVGCSLAKIARVRYFADENGPWMEAAYSVTRAGVEVVESLMQAESTRNVAALVLEATTAYASQRQEYLDDLILADLTYAFPGRATGAVIDLEDDSVNLSLRAAREFRRFSPVPDSVTAIDEIHLYTEYLERIRARVPGDKR